MTAQRVTTMALIVVLASSVGFSQVKTTVPDVVPGARPATVERITIHGKALEGNLEGNAVDRPADEHDAGIAISLEGLAHPRVSVVRAEQSDKVVRELLA